MTNLDDRLEQIRGGAPRRSPNVRVLAAFSAHTDCRLASLGFAARVDFDRLLRGTEFAPPFGQSPFAFTRGNRFEQMLRRDDYAHTRQLLQQQMGFSLSDGRIVNLRNGYPMTPAGMDKRAEDTRKLVREIVARRPHAANLIDGAVLQTEIAGVRANFEADALAARIGGLLHAGEVKSFPVVDQRADADKLAGALDQVAFYLLLLRKVVVEQGGDDALVSTNAMLITPRNVGLTPMLSVQDVTRRVGRAERLLSRLPGAAEVADSVPTEATFGAVADQAAEPARRVEALHTLADEVGTAYSPDCIGSCGNAFFCRARAFQVASPALVGRQAVRLLPCVGSLSRSAELADGANPLATETLVALHLSRAGRLYDELGSAPRPARRVSP